MAFQTSDASILLEYRNSNDLTAYTLDSKTFANGRDYFLVISARNVATIAGSNSIANTIVTPGITWTFINKYDLRESNAIVAYRGVSTGATGTTVVTFPIQQTFIDAWIIGVNNVSSTPIVQSKGASVFSDVYSLTLDETITAGNMGIVFYSSTGSSETWTITDAGMTTLSTDLTFVRAAGQFTLSEVSQMDITRSAPRLGYAVAFEIANATTSQFLISDVNSGATIADGQIGVVSTGIGFGASGSNFYLSPVNAFDHPDIELQTVTAQSDTSMTFDVVYPAGASGTVYAFVEDSALNVTAGFAVSIVSKIGILHTMFLVDSALNPLVCSSSDFSLGVSAYINYQQGNEQVASQIQSLGDGDTDSPAFYCYFDSEPVYNVDTITVIYTKSNGDIMSVATSQYASAALEDQIHHGTICPTSNPVTPTLNSIDGVIGNNELFANFSNSIGTSTNFTDGLVFKVNNSTKVLVYVSGAGSQRLKYTVTGVTFADSDVLNLVLTDSLCGLEDFISANDVTDANVSYNIPFTPPGGSSPVDLVWDFNSGSNGASAGGSDGFTSPMDSIYSRDITAAEGIQCCKCSIPAGTTGFGQWGGIINIPRVGPGNEFWASVKVWHPAGFVFNSNTQFGIKHLRIQRNLDSDNNVSKGYFDLLLATGGMCCEFEDSGFRAVNPNTNLRTSLGPNIERGQWNTYEMYARLTSGNDGLIRWWRNGSLLFESDGGYTTMPAGQSISRLYFLTYWNQDASLIQAQSLYVDQIRYTTTRPTNQDSSGNWMIGL